MLRTLSLFFDDDNDSDDTSALYINEAAHELKSGYYFKYAIPKNSSVEIGQGRFIPSNRNRTWKENGSSLFLSLSKFGLSPSKESPEYLSRYFNMGTLNPIDNDLGYLLVSLLKRGE